MIWSGIYQYSYSLWEYNVMTTEGELKFPTFECLISGTVEEMDSEVEQFFIEKNILAVNIARLKHKDREWSNNYDKVLQFLGDLSNSLVYTKDPPSHQFLIDLCMGEEVEADVVSVVKNATNEAVFDLMESSQLVSKIIFWYVRNSKQKRFSKSYNVERFQGLPFLRLALVYRAIKLSGKSKS